MESTLRCITHHLCVAAAKELVPHMAEDLHGRLVVRAIALPRHAPDEPILSERPDVRRMLLPAHVVDRMGFDPARYARVSASHESMRIDYACFRALT